MSKKKKNVFLLLGLLVLLAGIICLYVFIPKEEQGEEKKATDVTIPMNPIDTNNIEEVSVEKNGNKHLYTLCSSKNGWCLKSDKTVPVDQDAVTNMLANIAPVTATKELDMSDAKLEDYGLCKLGSNGKSYLQIKVKTKEKEYIYMLGSKVPVDGGYYAIGTGYDDKVYCVKQNIATSFDVKETSLIVKDELPKINSDYLTSINIEDMFVAKVVSKNKRVSSYSPWNIYAPFPKPMSTSSKNWSGILDYFTNMTYKDLVEYKAKDKAKYGLGKKAKTIKLKYFTTKANYNEKKQEPTTDNSQIVEVPNQYRINQSLTLKVGKTTKGAYYVCKEGSDSVYTIDKTSIDNIFNIDAEAAMDHCVYTNLATDLKGYEAIYGGKKLVVTRKALPKKKDQETTNNNLWKLNGKKIAEKNINDFLTPYSAAYLLEYSGTKKLSVKPKSKKPVLTMIYHEQNRDVTIKYLPYDGTNFYKVDRDGNDIFLVDKRSVDDIIKKFKGIEKFAK